MKFGINEILRSFEVAFDLKKVTFQAVGSVIALLGLIIFSWLGALTENTFIIGLFSIIGITFFYVVTMGTAGGVTRMISKEILGGEEIDSNAAFNFAKGKIFPLIFSPIVMTLFLLGVVIAQVLISFIGKIPFIGEIIIATLTIPLIILNVTLIITAFFGFCLIAVIIAIEEFSTTNTVKRVLMAIRNAPLQLVAYNLLAFLVGAAVIWAIGLIYFCGLTVTTSIFWATIQKVLDATQANGLSPSLWIAGVIGGVSFLTATVFVLSYATVFVQGISVSIYLAIKERIG